MPSPQSMLSDAVSLLQDVKNARNGECVTVFGENKYIFSNYAEVIDFVLNFQNGFYYKIRHARSLEEILDICTAFNRDGSFIYQVEGNVHIEPDINPHLMVSLFENIEKEPFEVARKDGTTWSISCQTEDRGSKDCEYKAKILNVKKV